MEAFEEKSQLDDEQPSVGLGFQADLADSSFNEDNLKQIRTQKLENEAICCNDGTMNRDFLEHSIVPDEESEVRRVMDDEICHLVVKAAIDESVHVEKKYDDVRRSVDEALERHGVKMLLENFSIQCRVSRERGVGEYRLGHEKEAREIDDGDEKVFEHKENDLKGKHEFETDDELGDHEALNDEHIDEEQSGNESGSVTVPDDDRQKSYHYPFRPDAEDCSYYMRSGMCKFGSSCRFNHPLRRRNQEAVKQREEESDRPGKIECKFYLSPGGCKYGKACKYNHSRERTSVAPVLEYNFVGLPIRLGEKECPYYMRNGSCKYGPNCRFNHPNPSATYENGSSVHLQSVPRTTMPSWSAPRPPNETAPFISMLYSPTHHMPPPTPDWNGYQACAPIYPTSELSRPTPLAFFINNPARETNLYTHQQQPISDFPERPGQLECSYFMKTGDCKYRSACKFHHPKSHIPTPTRTPSVLSNNGLPLRPDQNICTHYSRYGICKYGPACKYDHPVNYSNSLSTGGYRPNGLGQPLTQQLRNKFDINDV